MIRILVGDCRDVLRTLPAESAQCVVTSPPYYGLRDYGVDGQIGLEASPDAFIAEMVDVFREARRVLRKDGTLWLNLGDSYVSTPPGNKAAPKDVDGAFKRRQERQLGHGENRVAIYDKSRIEGLKQKDLLMIPARVALALQADGWWLRSHIIWHKPNPMPESVTDRPTSAHESVFLLTKSQRYFYDADAVREPFAGPGDVRIDTPKNRQMGLKPTRGYQEKLETDGRNLRNVWSIPSQPFSGAHFATFPPALIEPCIKAGSRPGDMVLDPFGGAGTTALVADRLQRDATLIELNPEYARIAAERIRGESPMFCDLEVA